MTVEVALVVSEVEMAVGLLTLMILTSGGSHMPHVGFPTLLSSSLTGTSFPLSASHCLGFAWLVLVSWNRLLFFLNEPAAFPYHPNNKSESVRALSSF